MVVASNTADAEMEEQDESFDGFSQDDGFIEVSKRKKRNMVTSPTQNAGKTQNKDGCSSAKPSWDVINCIDPETLKRINKGT